MSAEDRRHFWWDHRCAADGGKWEVRVKLGERCPFCHRDAHELARGGPPGDPLDERLPGVTGAPAERLT